MKKLTHSNNAYDFYFFMASFIAFIFFLLAILYATITHLSLFYPDIIDHISFFFYDVIINKITEKATGK